MQKGDNKMIPRYTRPEMEKIWNERNEWQTMLDVEIAACEANAELGRIPKEAVEVIKAKANFDVDRIHASRFCLPWRNTWATKPNISTWALLPRT